MARPLSCRAITWPFARLTFASCHVYGLMFHCQLWTKYCHDCVAHTTTTEIIFFNEITRTENLVTPSIRKTYLLLKQACIFIPRPDMG